MLVPECRGLFLKLETMANWPAPLGTVAGQHRVCEYVMEQSHTIYGSWKANKQKGRVLGSPSRASPPLYCHTPSFPAPTVLSSDILTFLLDPVAPQAGDQVLKLWGTLKIQIEHWPSEKLKCRLKLVCSIALSSGKVDRKVTASRSCPI